MIRIPLPANVEAKLRERATESGEDVSAYAARLLQDALNAPSVNELLAQFRKQVEESGVTDQELDQLGEELRDEVWREQCARKANTG
jgi:hypothetical protein